MSNLNGVVDTGAEHIRRWLGVLRDDLLTARVDPLPPSMWLRWLPHGVVWIVAIVVTIVELVQLHELGLVPYGIVVPVALCHGGAMLLVLWRPVLGWWTSLAAMVVGAFAVRAEMVVGDGTSFTWPWSSAGLVGHVFVLLLLALRVPTRVSVEALALTALVTWVLQGWIGARDYGSTGGLAVILSAVVVVLGIALRGRREARAELEQQTTLTAEERARRTLLEERSRIARELHDVVAHHMSVISIQAQVAPHLVKDPPDELRENLAGIRQNAVEALTELRRVLDVLRSEHPGPGERADAPQPTLDRLETLVENTRAAGLTVTTEVTGDRRPLPPGVELSAYRIVQEALSNVLRHAPGATAHVTLAYGPHALRVQVVNTAPTREAPPSAGARHGLLGMRERAVMLGGTLTAGPWSGRGFRIEARLPVPAPSVTDNLPQDGTA
ncbi:sensor histidine kinase [Actinospica acidiphila]|uniref:histidine kinase n=1 Tax=Actinospica acidiphila TaxID=304899 RepID=A0A9X5HEW6_9ACTN|nr:sensor histidine kinase [Actinospica acidiphila]NEC52205.1 sensor histidine kinase [Actinospica acidiphila]